MEFSQHHGSPSTEFLEKTSTYRSLPSSPRAATNSSNPSGASDSWRATGVLLAQKFLRTKLGLAVALVALENHNLSRNPIWNGKIKISLVNEHGIKPQNINIILVIFLSFFLSYLRKKERKNRKKERKNNKQTKEQRSLYLKDQPDDHDPLLEISIPVNKALCCLNDADDEAAEADGVHRLESVRVFALDSPFNTFNLQLELYFQLRNISANVSKVGAMCFCKTGKSGRTGFSIDVEGQLAIFVGGKGRDLLQKMTRNLFCIP